MNESVRYIADNPQEFANLTIEEQLGIVAELSLYWAERKIDALRSEGKTRVDSSLEAQSCYNFEKYWEKKGQNVKKLAELETARIRQGI